MDSPSTWSLIQELIIKSIEGIFEVRLKEKSKFRRNHSSTQNIVLQTLIPENCKIRDEDIDFNFMFPWSLTINILLSSTIIEQWKFIFSVMDKYPLTEVYKQATTSLRSVISLAHLLPAYSIFKQGLTLTHSFTDLHNLAPKCKKRLILLKCQSGTLFLEVAFTKNPDTIDKVPEFHVPKAHGQLTPPGIEWNPASLSVSSSSSDLVLPYSPLGSCISFSAAKELPSYLVFQEDPIQISSRKERKSYDMSQLARECSKLHMNIENAISDVEGYEEVLKEFYCMQNVENLDRNGCQ